MTSFVTSRFICCIVLATFSSKVQAALPTTVDQVADIKDECERLDPDLHLIAHFDWPFTLSCEDLAVHFADNNHESDEYDFQTAECNIRDLMTSETLLNDTFEYNMWEPEAAKDTRYFINDVDDETPTTYIILFKILDHCSFRIVHLNKTHHTNLQCDELTGPIVIDFPARVGSLHTMECPHETSVPPYIHANPEDVTYEWTHNCTEPEEPNIIIIGDKLQISETTFENGGTYECRIMYKNRTRYAIKYVFCVSYAQSFPGAITLNCPPVVVGTISSDLTVNCVADLGAGEINLNYLSSTWNRVGEKNLHCENLLPGYLSNSTGDREANCIMPTDNFRKIKCYQYNPDKPMPNQVITLSLTIRNLKKADIGLYNLSIKYVSLQETVNFTILTDETKLMKSHIIAIAACTAFVVFFLLVAFLCFWKKHDVMWYFKKYFGPCEREIYTYIVYIAYFYDNDNEKMSKTSRERTEKFVENFHEFLNKFGGTTYDDQKDVSHYQYEVENICRIQKECHRILVVLTPEYIADQWSIHKAYRALHNVIEEGKKLIFVIVPGTKQALDKLEGEAKATLLRAIKMNKTIKWGGKVPFSGKFRRRLEYALPKLQPPAYSRYLSTSSQAQLTLHNKHGEIPTPTFSESQNRFDSLVV